MKTKCCVVDLVRRMQQQYFFFAVEKCMCEPEHDDLEVEIIANCTNIQSVAFCFELKKRGMNE